jgi:hypothetical protein
LPDACARAIFVSSEYKFLLVIMVQFLRNEKGTEQELLWESDSEEVILTESDGGYDEDTATAGCHRNLSESQVHIWSRLQHPWNSGGVPPFTGGPSGLRIEEALVMNRDATPITVFLLFFIKVIQLLVTKTN